jgi:hypothetical protein
MRNIVSNITQGIYEWKHRIAMPFVSDAVSRDRENLLKFFKDTRTVEREALLKRLDSITYEKPWDKKNTTLDQAFDLAVHEAIAIVREELRK